MKLAIMGLRGIPARYGGFETFAEELSVRLCGEGTEVTVYCEHLGNNLPHSYKGVALSYIRSHKLGPMTTILFDLKCLWHACKGHDVIYMLGYGAAIFSWLPRIWDRSIWINMDGIEWKRSKWGPIARWYLKVMETVAVRSATRLIADAEAIRRFLHERHGTKTPCSVIPYGADLLEHPPDRKVLEEYGLLAGTYYLVVCRLEPENHVLEILRGYCSSTTDATIIVIGDTATGTRYVRRILQETDRRVHFLGTVYDKDKLRTLRYYCRAYFHGHSVGGTNPSLLEALGCGNIVIAHDNVFNREVAGDAGRYFIAADDIPRLVAGVESLTEGERTACAARSRNRISGRYSWDVITRQYMDLLKTDRASVRPLAKK